MNTYARIAGGVVAELISPPANFTLAECYTAEVVAQCEDVSAVMPAPQIGWTATETAGVWSFAAPAAPAQTPAQIAAAAVESAKSALTDSDITVVRCYEHSVAVPAEWTAYRTALRSVVNGTSDTLPAKPTYPAGT